MAIKIIGTTLQDDVLNADYLMAEIKYSDAIQKIYPLIQRLEIQRNLQDPSFYSRLRKDLKIGCVIPSITIAFIDDEKIINRETINENIEKGFVLDGIQRLNALHKVFEEIDNDAEKIKYQDRILHLNIIIAPSMDRLLYRMITLNNGQKPMSPRHQIDILTETIIDFDNLELRNQSQKNRQVKKEKLAIQRSDIIKGYVGYLANTTAIDNKIIIEEKMDELIAEKIIESDFNHKKHEFIDILNWIASKYTENEYINNWFISSNNFIGFCVACRDSFETINQLSDEELTATLLRFELIFSNFDKKKIKVGDFRRKMVSEYFRDIERIQAMNNSDVIIHLSSH